MGRMPTVAIAMRTVVLGIWMFMFPVAEALCRKALIFSLMLFRTI